MSLLNIAHRGASSHAPENTLEAFQLAIVHNADMIETDLHLTADGVVVVTHDPDVGGVAIDSMEFIEFYRQRPFSPALGRVLDSFADPIPFNLEIKYPRSGYYDGIEAAVLDSVRKHGVLSKTLFSSFRLPVLQRLRELESTARIGALIEGGLGVDDVRMRVDVLRAEAVHVALSWCREDRVAELHALGVKVYVFTVDRWEDQRRLIEWGVDGIFTNDPGALNTRLGRESSAETSTQ